MKDADKPKTPGVHEGTTSSRIWASPAGSKTYHAIEAPVRHTKKNAAKLVTLHNVKEHKQIEQGLRLDEARLEALLKLSQMTEASMEEIADFVAEHVASLTGSTKVGLGFMDDRGNGLTKHAWWPKSQENCAAANQLKMTAHNRAGSWGNAIRSGNAVIINDPSAAAESSRGCPEGHVPLSRFIIVPVFDGKRVMAIAGAGNKPTDYDQSDVRQVILLLDGMCKLIRRKQADEALRESEKTLRQLASRLLALHEEERTRLAHEIHDKVGQTLVAIKFGVESALAATGGEQEMVLSLGPLVPKVQEAIDEVRRLYTDLRPSVLDDFGIVAAIAWCCREFHALYRAIRIEEQIDIEEESVPHELKIIIFRIVQEALRNVAKHSRADHVSVALRAAAGSIRLTVQDNGLGYETEAGTAPADKEVGVGLPSMKERVELSGGSFDVSSTPGYGTTVRASWPFGADSEQS